MKAGDKDVSGESHRECSVRISGQPPREQEIDSKVRAGRERLVNER